MKIQYGKGTTEYGPGASIELTGDEVVVAIEAWLVANNVRVEGPRTTSVNGEPCRGGHVYVDPSGSVVVDGKTISGRGV